MDLKELGPLCTAGQVQPGQRETGADRCSNQYRGVGVRVRAVQARGPGSTDGHGLVLALQANQELNGSGGLKKCDVNMWIRLSFRNCCGLE